MPSSKSDKRFLKELKKKEQKRKRAKEKKRSKYRWVTSRVVDQDWIRIQ
jgi:hypothetical protein